ncbi:MAG: hypothetical protein CMI09_15165 [Oceanospirillaceae bacterium]|nr:hypothetical protein [Oceanospirillaceae bacterium]
MFAGLFGKYRAVVISVAMFIILDAGVLVLNFYISSQLAEDATNVNLAGRQRMLSQKTAKSLFEYQRQLEIGASTEAVYRELNNAVNLFEKTLNAFDKGGETTSASGQSMHLNSADTAAARKAIGDSQQIWGSIHIEFERLFSSEPGVVTHDQALKALIPMVAQNNNKLLKLMNDLTNELERIARDKSNTLRMIQAAAITLAILNFFLILFHFLGQLRRSDAVAEEARQETQEILKTVREGLFLLDEKMVIGTQYSGSVKDIFGDKDYSGMSFRELLKSVVVESDMKTVEEYIKLLLNSQVKENLIGSLNPLSDLEVSLPTASGGYEVKHLSFRFNRAIENGEIRHILVTVLDITELVSLRQDLEKANQNTGLQIGALKELLHVDRDSMEAFLKEADASLVAVNDILKERVTSSYDYLDKINSTYRIIHRIKGDASALNVPNIVSAAHDFEEQLSRLREKDQLQGGDFLPLTLALNDLFRLLTDTRDILSVFHRSQTPVVQQLRSEPSLDHAMINRLASRIAEDQGKEVSVVVDDKLFPSIALEHRKMVQDAVLQLVRNAVVHGIEIPAVRVSGGKSAAGAVTVALKAEESGIRVCVHDDGQGIDLDRVRERALERGMYSAEQLEAMQPNRIVSLIFEPGFSTLDTADEHGGRGVGMDIVKANIQQIRGRIRVSNRPGRHCEISFLLPHPAREHSESMTTHKEEAV